MKIHQLRYLLAVADEGSFTAAAARELVSQSGVSAQVAKLERELGVTLLERGSRTVTLTAAGRAVAPHARQVIASLTGVSDVADAIRGLLRGRVRMGLVTGCSIPWVLDGLADFRAFHPAVELSLVEDGSTGLVDGVLRGDLDLALVGHVGEVPGGLEHVVVVDERLVAVVSTGHRWATRRRLRLADLVGETVLSLPRGNGVRTALDRSLDRAGNSAPPVIEASSPETVLGLAARGAGIAVLSASMSAGRDDVVAVPLVDATVRARLSLVWRPAPPASTARLLAVLRRQLSG